MGGKVNRQWVTNVTTSLTEIARLVVPKGVRRMAFAISLGNQVAFNAFQLRARLGGAEFTLANAGAGFTTPVAPLVRASGDLTAQAADTSGFLLIDVEGLDEISLFASIAAGGPTVTTVVASD